MDSLSVRFRIDTDSIETNQEGWMLDDMMIYVGIVHTVNEEDPNEYMVITPNPTSGRINIDTRKEDGPHIIEKIELIDMSGKVVQEFGISPTKFYIDISSHPNGTYLLKVQTNIKTEIFRVVLQKE